MAPLKFIKSLFVEFSDIQGDDEGEFYQILFEKQVYCIIFASVRVRMMNISCLFRTWRVIHFRIQSDMTRWAVAGNWELKEGTSIRIWKERRWNSIDSDIDIPSCHDLDVYIVDIK